VRVALTGATGLVGGALLDRLLAAGHEVDALVRPGRAGVGSGPPLASRAGLSQVEGLLPDVGAIDALLERADAVVHAAFADVEDPDSFVEQNVLGTLRLLARLGRTRQRQLVFVSSLAVYGPAPGERPGAKERLTEDCGLWPAEFYGAHKLALEKLVHAASGAPGLNTAIFRLGAVLGAYPASDRRRDYLAQVFDEAREHGEIRRQLGAYVLTAEDAAALLVAALGDPSARGLVCNTFDRWLDFGTLAAPIAGLLGREVALVAAPAPEPRPGLSRARLAARRPAWDTMTRIGQLLRGLADRSS
jgi:nucleoside-diphosphate-sugar epimerase